MLTSHSRPEDHRRNADVLTINVGSSSIKFAVFTDGTSPERVLSGQVERIGSPKSSLSFNLAGGKTSSQAFSSGKSPEVMQGLLEWFKSRAEFEAVQVVVHRLVHGGPKYREPQRVTPDLLAELRRISLMDPDHLPSELKMIQAIQEHFPHLSQVACFDTAFHAGMPRVARLLPIHQPHKDGVAFNLLDQAEEVCVPAGDRWLSTDPVKGFRVGLCVLLPRTFEQSDHCALSPMPTRKNSTRSAITKASSRHTSQAGPSSDETDPPPGENERDNPSERDAHPLRIVGLGGSAGGLIALQAFFSHLPADSGMAFVVVMHLSPDHESTLGAILQRSTSMPVVQVQATIQVARNHVYVIPPRKDLSIARGFLRLTNAKRPFGKHVAVDLFFRALADNHGPGSVAVVLSGADGDGSIGLKRIKERGGLTIAQKPEEAEQDSMPRSAIATGMVDWVLPVAEIPARLLEYHRGESRLSLPSETEPREASSEMEDNETALRETLKLLRTQTGRDFSYYKRATVLRRIARRMQINGIVAIADYFQFLSTHPGEARALLQDLLISVTNFFRDREAFTALATEIPKLFVGKQASDEVRVWVAGCATGEEAYSVAMLLHEYASRLESAPALQVFASDLDEAAIATAREGIYPESIVADVSAERIGRFFTKHVRGYRVRAELREMVLFALHDLLQDPPFSRLDLVTCRNLLIYINRDVQGRAFEVFHFALRAKGLLFLGTSESVDEKSSLFATLSKKHRLYVRRAASQQMPPLFSGSAPVPLARHTLRPTKTASHAGKSGVVLAIAPPSVPTPDARSGEERFVPWSELHFKVLERYAPPSVIVNASHQIVHLSEHANRFVRFEGGGATLDLLRIIHPMLRVDLRSALFRAGQTQATVEVRGVPVDLDGERRLVTLRVCPALDAAPDFLLVIFEESTPVAAEVLPALSVSSDAATRHLEEQVDHLNAQLAETVEEYEFTTDELKSSNEELLTRNEELRSASEELETGREEFQSVNEELSTVNQELRSNVEQLHLAHSNLQNLIESTHIATVFLDRDLRVQWYTPSAIDLFKLIPSDTGRPLSDLSHRLEYPEISDDAARVLTEGGSHEREVAGPEHRWFLARLQPYHLPADKVMGVVLTFVDITKRKQAEDNLRTSEERSRLATFHSPFPIMLHADDGEVLQVNDAWTHQTGYTADELRTVRDWIERAYLSQEAREAAWQFLAALPEQFGVTKATNRRIHCVDGRECIWDLSFANLGRLPDGRVLRITMAVDVTERFQAETELRAAKVEAERANAAKSEFLSRMSHELRTPLNAILGFGQVLEMSKLDAQDAHCIQLMLQGGRHLLALVDEVLDLARVEAGQLELKIGLVSLERLAQECVGLVARLAHARHLTCTTNFRGGAPVLVLADEQRLRQVVLNLLANAIKYNHEGGQVTLTCEPRGERTLRLSVKDTGPGISPQNLVRLFVPFERLGREVSEIEGTGLGLVVSMRLVEAMGGKLGAESVLGEGSTFWIDLSAVEEVLPEPTISLEAAATLVPAAEPRSSATLLYIEDNLSNLQVMKTILERLRPHWHYLSARDGQNGLRLAREHLPDLILLDLQLPGLKGDAVLEELRAEPNMKRLPVLMLSADATAHSRERLLALGATEYLSKPFNIAVLLEKIDAMLQAAPSKKKA